MNSEQPIETLTATPVVQRWPHGPTTFEQRYGNGTMRVVTAIIGIPIVLGAVWIGGWAFFGLITLASIGALLEFYWMAEKKGAYPNKVVGVVAIICLCFLFQAGIVLYTVLSPVGIYQRFLNSEMPRFVLDEIPLLFAIVFALPVIALLIEMFRKKEGANLNISTTIAGIGYIGLCLPSLLGIRNMPYLHAIIGPVIDDQFIIPSYDEQFYIVVAILLSIWVCDSFAYYGGRLFGKHKLFERVSPKKTWEGAICGVIGAIGGMMAMHQWGMPFLNDPILHGHWVVPTLTDTITMGLICGVFGQLGDLAESHLKRDAGVKDSSQLIPGHGGILDRFDSLLFVSPLIYLYLLIRTGSMWLQ